MDQSNGVKDYISSLAKNYRVLPLFEKSIVDYQRKKHSSLQSNKYLACKWQECKDNIAKKKNIPFNFPHVSDFHFYKNRNCYKPSESIKQRTDFRYKLVPGPGVDAYGDIPITTDLCFRSTVAKPSRKPVGLVKSKTKKKMM